LGVFEAFEFIVLMLSVTFVLVIGRVVCLSED
jgi:hypothetical protein